jgi:uncharacterized RDD family membrane protein YckC/type II secretory pathway pseudopilin PulG
MDNANIPPQNPVPSPAPADPVDDADVSAGFWLRAGAYMLDGLIIVVVSLIPMIFLPEAARAFAQLLIAGVYFSVLPVVYNGQTPGKMAAGVRIVRMDGSPLTYGRACARWLSYLLSNITLCLGFLCAAFTPQKRALHDYIVDTRVVRVEELGFGRKLAMVLVGLLFPALIVLGAVAALMIPRLSGLKGLADEGAAKGRLGSLRSALSIYYGDTNGTYPADLNALAPKYIPAIDPAAPSSDQSVPGVETYGPEVCTGSAVPNQQLDPAKLRNTGKWGYVVAPKAPCDGAVFIDSTKADSKGTPWYSY